MSRLHERITALKAKLATTGIGAFLDPALPEDEIRRFEERHGITLPEPYRHFLAEIGDGGVGPGGNDNRRLVEETYYDPYWFLLPDVSREFPYTEASSWREDADTTGVEGGEGGEDSTPENGDDLDALDAPDDFDDLDDAADLDTFDDFEKRRHGSLLLRDDGCGTFQLLIVTGPARGQVWTLTEELGISPRAVDYLAWYERWLDGPYE